MSTRKLLMVMRVALESLTGHKLRSFLTMLGVVIGVGAVIALVAVGQGAQAQVVSQFQSLGSNMLTVQAGSEAQFGRGGLRQTIRALNATDVDAIKGLATTVALVSPEYSANNATVTYQGKTTSISVTGVTAEYAPVRNWSVSMGRFITAEDDSNVAMVAILGQKTVETLFGSATANPIGETIRINRQSYEVIGVLKAKGQSGASNQDNVVMIPLRTAQLKLGGAGTTTLRTIALQVRSAGEMDLAQAQVTAILRSLHGIQTGGSDDFTVRNQSDIVETVTADHQHVHDAAGQHRGHLAPGGRHRDHEHHAGERDRADAGDRGAQGRGGQARRHPGAVPRRGHRPQRAGRDHRRGRGCGQRPVDIALAGHQQGSGNAPERDHGAGGVVGHRHLLWLLPSQPGCRSEPDRRLAIRVGQRGIRADQVAGGADDAAAGSRPRGPAFQNVEESRP